MKTLKFFSLPYKFYRQSGSAVGTLYKQDKLGRFERTDYGEVQLAADRGRRILIVPPPAALLKWAEAELKNILKRWEDM